ncbi:chemotaxis protein CheB [Picosynechococcus sp. PCC 73109]|uniref:chemotaxis protein CheB n=1 Tax=Picosynechococcus sp. PCC 73109 TaxID=374982 RepID=UPI00074590D7|nr:chemotaxis protein CheB [Picosynechococcus sp. PCC 73109]AMA10658.1 hypothetical protein AWQ23_14515 [Picosynechococcus sp. PCC 73109]
MYRCHKFTANIKKYFSGLQEKIIFCNENLFHILETGKIFIIPDTETIIPSNISQPKGFLSDTFLVRYKNKLSIHVSTNIKGKYNVNEFKKWLKKYPFDLSHTKREVMAKDINNYRKTYPKTPIQQLPRNESEDFGDSKKILDNMMKICHKLGVNDCLYRDLPCIDKIIDNFAQTQDIVLAGLLLCGCFGDGALGFKTLKEKGFHTAIQTPEECQCDIKNRDNSEMPKTALTVCQNHEQVTLFDTPNIKTLEEWLLEIKDT